MQRFESCRPSQRVRSLRVNKRMSLKTARFRGILQMWLCLCVWNLAMKAPFCLLFPRAFFGVSFLICAAGADARRGRHLPTWVAWAAPKSHRQRNRARARGAHLQQRRPRSPGYRHVPDGPVRARPLQAMIRVIVPCESRSAALKVRTRPVRLSAPVKRAGPTSSRVPVRMVKEGHTCQA
jgi:hypothetical protein